MGRVYAGILGPLALIVVVIRSLRYGGGVEATMLTASLCMIGFAILGYVAGQCAAWIVEESVRSKVSAELGPSNDENDQNNPNTN